MQVIFETRNPEALRMRSLAERRTRDVLRRLSWLAPRAHVHLSDVNGPRGGIDKRCQIELLSDNNAPVVVTSMARSWRAALYSALARAVRSLLHAVQRTRRAKRTPRLLPATDR
jgi:hypothetical protein